jgi:hypothetical protein
VLERRPDSLVALVVQRAQPRAPSRELVDDLSRPIGRPVVARDDFVINRGTRQQIAGLFEDAGNRRLFVVRRKAE